MLTDEQIDKAYREVWSTIAHDKRLVAFARAIESSVRTEIARLLRQGGASLPIACHGTVESAIKTGLSIALCLVEVPASTQPIRIDDAHKEEA